MLDSHGRRRSRVLRQHPLHGRARDVNGFANGNQGIQNEKYATPADADIIWELDMMKELGVHPHDRSNGSPLIVGDKLFVEHQQRRGWEPPVRALLGCAEPRLSRPHHG